MSGPDSGPTPPDRLPDDLARQLESLDIPELKAVRTYVNQRIQSLRSSIEEEIEATAAGEIIDIENHGAYALVRKHPPDPDGPGVNTDVTALYHVKRSTELDGEESLQWAYIGEDHKPEQTRCKTCGRTLDAGTTVCPDCGSEQTDDTETED